MASLTSSTDVTDSLVSILSDLIGIRSDYPPGDTGPICSYAEARLTTAGYQVQNFQKVSPIQNLVAKIGDGAPSVVFNVHVDTVGPGSIDKWLGDPFQAEVSGGRIRGLGAANCKSSMAVHLWLAEEISRRGGIKRGSLCFSFVGDEEALGPNGTKILRDQRIIGPSILIVGAPTSNDLLIDERGVMWIRVTAYGKGGHAGDPDSADNAIDRLVRLLSLLDRRVFTKLGNRKQDGIASTCNVGKISGGHNTNVVPDEATAEIDRRLLPNESVEQALEEIENALSSSGEPAESYRVELILGTDGFKGRSDGQGVTAFKEAIQQTQQREPSFLAPIGAFDGRHFSNDGIEIINVGPGNSGEGHTVNESVMIDELLDAAVIHLDAVDRLLDIQNYKKIEH